MPARRFAFLAGLFLTTLATLTLELLDTRLLSVLTWYHLSFFAVSTAMFGMSAGAVRVYLGGARFSEEHAPRALVRAVTALAAPFYVSGVAVALALTRVPGPSGLVYAVDLASAALGSLLVLPLLESLDISSAALACGAVAEARPLLPDLRGAHGPRREQPPAAARGVDRRESAVALRAAGGLLERA